MNYLYGFSENRILLSALIGWAAAQIIKLLLYTVMNRTFRIERLVGSGGMPSSHAATVCALATSVAKQFGTASFEFAVSFILAAIVLYDARGVRLETGKQAVTIRAIAEFLKQGTNIQLPSIKLKELVGHTAFQVIVGGFLGIAVGTLVG